MRSFCRSSRPEVFNKKGVLRNFAKFTGKHLCQSLLPATLLKKRLWHRCFPVNFEKLLRTPFFTEHYWWLFLVILKLQLNQEMDCDYYEEYLMSISSKISLRQYLEKLREKLIQNPSCQVVYEFMRRRDVVHIIFIEFFLHQRT